MNSEEIERGRDPNRLSSRERLNCTLVLVRIPPSYEGVNGAVRKKVEAGKRLAAIREAVSAVLMTNAREMHAAAALHRADITPDGVTRVMPGSCAFGRR